MKETCLKKLTGGKKRGAPAQTVLLEVLHQAHGPLSPLALMRLCHRAGRRVNKTTIYRGLELMERAGIVTRVVVSDRRQYFELTERGHHHHFICTECEQIREVAIAEGSLMEQAKRLGKQMGFLVSSHAIEFYGRCATCVTLPKGHSV